MSKRNTIDFDPIAEARIRESLAAPPPEPKRNVPKSTPVEALQRWNLKPAPAHTRPRKTARGLRENV